ncbi:MAG TPA: hypothetical protein VFW76_10250 [Ktedonobacterales bacterium]|nr:hypothetical protein [Ktedonobacterales bacterium]
MDQLVATWKSYLERVRWERALAEAEANDDSARATEAQEALAHLPVISALEALEANAHLVSMLSAQRWIAMRAAREQGATLEQIGKMLGVSRQSAWEFFQRKIAEQQQHGRQERQSPQDAPIDPGEKGPRA